VLNVGRKRFAAKKYDHQLLVLFFLSNFHENGDIPVGFAPMQG